jgi:putative DNA-invertase from lambdoid prophage Rac
MLRAVVRMESAARSERSKTGLLAAQRNGQHTGRPTSLSRAEQERVMRALDSGSSVTEVSRRFRTSRQTIMRIRTAAAAGRQSDKR